MAASTYDRSAITDYVSNKNHATGWDNLKWLGENQTRLENSRERQCGLWRATMWIEMNGATNWAMSGISYLLTS